jgi:hypothetical protein
LLVAAVCNNKKPADAVPADDRPPGLRILNNIILFLTLDTSSSTPHCTTTYTMQHTYNNEVVGIYMKLLIAKENKKQF